MIEDNNGKITSIRLSENDTKRLKTCVLDIFAKHNFYIDRDFNIEYLPFFTQINGKWQESCPVYDKEKNTIYIALSNINYLQEQFVFQFAHECVHKYFDTPFNSESDISWREEFAASLVSYSVCEELGYRYAEFLCLNLEYNFNSVQEALPLFIKRIKGEYKECPAQVYSDAIKMPCLYYREHGNMVWDYLSNAYAAIKKINR